MAASRTMGVQSSLEGACANGRSGASMVNSMATSSTPMARNSAVHRLPAAMKRAIVNDTRSRGIGTSRTALTAEKRPRFSGGTRSGIRPCCAPCAVFEATDCRRAIANKNVKPANPAMPDARPVSMTVTTMPSVPTKMKGRRRPRRDVLRSDNMPISACHRSATISVHSRRRPRYVPLTSSPTNCWMSSGKTSPFVCERAVSAKKKMLMVI